MSQLKIVLFLVLKHYHIINGLTFLKTIFLSFSSSLVGHGFIDLDAAFFFFFG